MRRVSLALAFLAFTASVYAADDLSVDVQNASEPSLCAEKDNVYLKLASPEVRQFKIEAVHPAYIGPIVVDRSAFDQDLPAPEVEHEVAGREHRGFRRRPVVT